VIAAGAPSAGGLRAFAVATLATAVAGAVLAGAAIERALGGGTPAAASGAVGQVVPTGFGAVTVGTVTSGRIDRLQVAVTITNEREAPVRVDPRDFRLRLPSGRAVAPVGGGTAQDLSRLASATLVLRFQAPRAARAGALEMRSHGAASTSVDLRRVARGGAGGGGRAGHG
jgi:hypothetical protein